MPSLLHPGRSRWEARRYRQPDLARRWTSGRRVLPNALIVGAQRAGTTSCFNYLVQHPRVLRSVWKEVHFFDREHNWVRGARWYRAHFDLRAHVERLERQGPGPPIVLEATPGYMYQPQVPERMASVVPAARLIVLLRNPIERAFSNYKNALRKGRVEKGFDEVIEQALREVGTPIDEHDPIDVGLNSLKRGRYDEQLERLYTCFPREHVFVELSERFYRDPNDVCRRIFTFLGLDPIDINPEIAHNPSRDQGPMNPETRAGLAAFFAPHNARLAEILGIDPDWD